ncbi:MAG: cysteine desulfurase family protein [bacterium]
MKHIYLDNSATTQPSSEVILEVKKVMEQNWGNPSSVHSFGQDARTVLDQSRRKVAKFLNCREDEIIFTSGGSESDNLALRGVVEGYIKKNELKTGKLPHIITSMVEHHAVLHTVEEMESQGLIATTYLKPDQNGIISADQIEAAICDNTILVSLIYVNNETGVITPIKEIGERLKNINSDRKDRIFFHTDAVQAVEYLNIVPEMLNVDLLTIAAHKFHGPRGVGVLYVRKGIPIRSQISGGDQEFRMRAGTENVAAIAGMAKALHQIESRESLITNQVAELRNRLEAGIAASISDAIINGVGANRAPHISNVSFLNAEGEAIILNLDFLGIAVSSGSACTSRSLSPSHVLSAMGIPPEKAHGSIRFSLSHETTIEEIDEVLRVLPGIIKNLREMSPFK